uniref:Kit ligand n=1 Tax=Chelydra serpentina TaxID=8475 RepID=A0A8C3RQM7_CHESE
MKATTWIITCFYLQLLLLNPLVKAQSPCGNPVTDDVNDITKLVGNLPNDYRITLRHVRKMDTLPNHCWLHLMVPEFSKSLHNLLQKFSDMSDVLSNYSIINNLTRIINDIINLCNLKELLGDFVSWKKNEPRSILFIPEEFFRRFNSTIEAYKDFAETSDHSDCVLPSTTGTPENNPRVSVTKPFLLPPVAASSLRNDSSDSNSKEKGRSLGISIALPSLFSLLIGFTLGAICWKVRNIKLTWLGRDRLHFIPKQTSILILKTRGISFEPR